MNTKEELIAARKTIETPDRWTRHAYARDAFKDEVHTTSPDAVCWCALGAISAAAADQKHTLWSSSGIALRHALPEGFTKVSAFNDCRSTSHADVLALFDRAIAAQDGV